MRRRPYASRPLLLPLGLLPFLAVALLAGAISRPSDARPRLPRAMLSLSDRPYGRPIAPGFIGLSIEYTALRSYTGSDGANPVLVQLVKNLTPGQSPVLRIGGDSTDWSWSPPSASPGSPASPAAHAPPGIRFTITRDWMDATRKLAQALDAKLVLGINFEADSRQLAASEARALIGGIGREHIAALELGNEPELYKSFPWYVTGGRKVFGRPSSYDRIRYERDFAHVAAALPPLPIAGPAIGGQQWIHYTTPFIAAEPRLQLVTVHRYPLQRCYLPAASRLYPSIAHLLSATSTTGLADGVAPYAAAAHRQGLPFRIDEFNSVSCGGARGVSDTFASALWALDTLFELASNGVDGVNFHTFAQASYAPFRFTELHHHWTARVMPEYYGMLMFAQAAPPGSRLLHVYGRVPSSVDVWATRNHGVVRVVLINDGARGRLITLREPHPSTAGAQAKVDRLTAPSIRSTRDVALGGRSFGAQTTTGLLAAVRKPPTISTRNGVFALRVPAASAALVTLEPRRR